MLSGFFLVRVSAPGPVLLGSASEDKPSWLSRPTGFRPVASHPAGKSRWKPAFRSSAFLDVVQVYPGLDLVPVTPSRSLFRRL